MVKFIAFWITARSTGYRHYIPSTFFDIDIELYDSFAAQDQINTASSKIIH